MHKVSLVLCPTLYYRCNASNPLDVLSDFFSAPAPATSLVDLLAELSFLQSHQCKNKDIFSGLFGVFGRSSQWLSRMSWESLGRVEVSGLNERKYTQIHSNTLEYTQVRRASIV